MTEPKNGRAMGDTEYSLCKAIPGGSGITVLGLLLSRLPDPSHLQTALYNLQLSHPILRCKLTYNSNPTSTTFSVSPSPFLQIQFFDLPSTSNLLRTLSSPAPFHISPFHLLLEHELRQNPWSDTQNLSPFDVFFAILYSLSDSDHVLVLRFHAAVCDRTSAVFLSRELLGQLKELESAGRENWEAGDDISLPIEELVPKGKGDKPFWAHGVDLVGYSLNSVRLSNIGFEDICPDRCTQIMRFRMNKHETDRLLAQCKETKIKLCGALSAAGLMAAVSSKHTDNDQPENYAVVTFVDCRKTLDPVPSDLHLGYYHAAILNTHAIKKGDTLWDVAKRCHAAFTNSLKCDKHFKDMGVLNFLMRKAIENPNLMSSSSMRTSYIVVFEDPVIIDSCELHQDIGLEDYIGCASIHGIGPSIALSDTIRDGQLDCACLYPAPLHSRKQMQELIEEMKKILVEGVSS